MPLAGLERLLALISNILLAVAGLAITVMMIHVGADIVAKAVFNRPIVATLEIVAWYYMVATVFLPVAYIQVRKKHLLVELFTRNMSPARLALLEGVVAVLTFVYVTTLAYLTFEHAVETTIAGEVQDATFFDLPTWPARWLLPIAFGTMALVLILQAVRDLTYGITGRGAPTPQPKGEMVVEEA